MASWPLSEVRGRSACRPRVQWTSRKNLTGARLRGGRRLGSREEAHAPPYQQRNARIAAEHKRSPVIVRIGLRVSGIEAVFLELASTDASGPSPQMTSSASSRSATTAALL